MGRRLTRKEIKKKDPVTEALEGIWNYYVNNRKTVLVTLTVVIAAIGIFYIATTFYNRAQIARAVAFRQAMEAYNGRIDPTVKSDTKDVFPSVEAKYTASLKAFSKAADEYGSSIEGQSASFYKGVCLRELGRFAEAEGVFKKLAESAKDSKLIFFTNLALAETYRLQRKYPEALAVYAQIGKTPSSDFSEENITYYKALCLKESGQLREAYTVLKTLDASIQEKKNTNVQYYTPLEEDILKLLQSVKEDLARQGVTMS